MNNKPGVQTVLRGNEEWARQYIPDAYGLMETYLRSKKAQDIDLPIDKFERNLKGANIQIQFTNNLAKITITATLPKDEGEEEVSEDEAKKKRREEVEKLPVDFYRMFVHVDFIGKTSYMDASINYPFALSDITSVLVSATWNDIEGVMEELQAKTIDYVTINAGPDTVEAQGVYPNISDKADDIIRWYDNELPSEKNGPGTPSPYWDSSLPWAVRAHGTNFGIPDAPTETDYPWRLYIDYRNDPGTNPEIFSPAGLCHSTYHEYQAVVNEWQNYDHGRLARYEDGLYGCNNVATYFTPTTRNLAYYSRAYGQIFNGRQLSPTIEMLGLRKAYHVGTDGWMWVYPCWQGPITNSYSAFTLQDGSNIYNRYNDFGFNGSWVSPKGLLWFGEAMAFNQMLGGGPITASGVINVKASIGNDLDMFNMSSAQETIDATAAYVDMLELAITTAGATVQNPTGLSANLNTAPITFWGHSAKDIRSDPGTVWSSLPLMNVKLYMVPMAGPEKITHKIIEE